MDAAVDENRVRDFRRQVIEDAAAALSGVTVSIGDRLGCIPRWRERVR
jgi:hypothetical protein